MRPRRDRSDFDESKPETKRRVDDFRVLIEPGGETERIRKVQTHYPPGKFMMLAFTGKEAGLECGDGHMMGRLGIQGKEERSENPVHQRIRGGKMCRPSGPRGKGSLQMANSGLRTS